MNDELRINLNGLGHWNAICDFKADEQVDINQLLDEAKHDINYFNVILDFDDYLFLQNIINKLLMEETWKEKSLVNRWILTG